MKHLGNYFDTTMSDKMDCQSKIYAFMGTVNKLKENFGHLKGNVLFKSDIVLNQFTQEDDFGAQI